MPESIRFNPRTAAPALAVAILGLALPSLLMAQDTSECDCSCESYTRLQAAMEELRDRSRDGTPAMPPPELQTLATCAGQCAMTWGQCSSPRRDKPDSEADKPRREKSQPEPEKEQEAYALGEPRQDLERFHGVYGSDDRPGRDFFVTKAKNRAMEGREIPPGYLMVGAMWGDVAPWYMKSLGELRFEQQWINPGTDPLVVEFETDESGKAVKMRFLSGFLAERGEVRRVSDLPEGW